MATTVMRLLSAAILVLALASEALLSTRASGEETLWPNDVRRIDPSKQHYVRLPALSPSTSAPSTKVGAFRVIGLFRVDDGTSFTYKAKQYRVAGMQSIPNAQICKRPDGSRWACGLAARTSLQGLMARGVVCTPTEEGESITTVDCEVGGRDLKKLWALAYADREAGN